MKLFFALFLIKESWLFFENDVITSPAIQISTTKNITIFITTNILFRTHLRIKYYKKYYLIILQIILFQKLYINYILVNFFDITTIILIITNIITFLML